jgi:hypothetical protein
MLNLTFFFFGRAELYIAELYERNGQRALALAKYNDIIIKYPLRSQVGWFARLDRSRMVVMASDGTSLAEQQQILGWLHGMADQNAGEASIEPLLLLGESITRRMSMLLIHFFFFLLIFCSHVL